MAERTILLLVDSLGLSGKTKSLVDLAIHLAPQAYRPVVASLSGEASPLADRLKAAGIRVELLGLPGGFRPGTLLRLARLIREVEAEIVHCFNARPILLGAVAARLTGRPAIGSLSAFACQVPDREYVYLPQPLATTNRRQVYRNRVGCALVKFLVTVSPALGTRFFQYNGLPARKLRTIPYGIDVGLFQRYSTEEIANYRAAIGIPADQIVIGSVGRLVEEKDYPTQIRAFATAVRRIPNLRMALAGDGPLRTSLEELACSLGVADRIHFIGHCNTVALFMRTLDIFVLGSKFETFGIALLEAKAAGLAAVATNIHEIPEILSYGKSGCLIPAQDPNAMADAFVALATKPELRHALGKRALAEAVDRHSLEAMVRGYKQLYAEVLG